MGTLGGFALPSAPANPPCLPLAALGLAMPSRALAPPGEARLRQRELMAYLPGTTPVGDVCRTTM
jgi:hypothetical protein